MFIRSYSESLSDGSDVVNIVLNKDGVSFTLHPCTPDDAAELVAKLMAAIQEHTVDNVTAG